MFNLKNKINSLYLSLFVPHGKYLSDLQKGYSANYFFGAKQVPHAEFLDLLRKKYYAIIERKIADTEAQNQMEINFHILRTTNIELFIKDICQYADKNDIHIILNLEMVEKTYTTAEMNILQRYGFVENKQAKSIFRRPRPKYCITL